MWVSCTNFYTVKNNCIFITMSLWISIWQAFGSVLIFFYGHLPLSCLARNLHWATASVVSRSVVTLLNCTCCNNNKTQITIRSPFMSCMFALFWLAKKNCYPPKYILIHFGIFLFHKQLLYFFIPSILISISVQISR